MPKPKDPIPAPAPAPEPELTPYEAAMRDMLTFKESFKKVPKEERDRFADEAFNVWLPNASPLQKQMLLGTIKMFLPN